MKRLFLALPIEDHIKEALEETGGYFNQYKNILNIVAAENYHITLKFLGDTEDKRCEEISESLQKFSPGTDKIKFSLKGLGTFPAGNNANVIWAGINTDLQIIEELQNKVEDFSEFFGYKREKRKFTPHLTLARVKRNKLAPKKLMDYIQSNKETFFTESFFTRIVLFESELKPTGPEYREITSIELKK